MKEVIDKNEIKVSVILSVYNTDDYLKKCINSLLNQTLEQIEIIAVNNGSTDKSGDILKDFETNNPNKIKVITFEKNTGDPAEPWNYGISISRGQYIAIVDSDDWCENTMLEKLYCKAIEDEAQMVFCNCYEVYGEENMVPTYHMNEQKCTVKNLILNPHLAPWAKIYHKDIFKKKNFKFKSQIHCDTGFNLIVYSYLEKVAYINDVLYYYNKINPNSETNTKKRMRQATIVDTLDYVLENCNEKYMDEIVFFIFKFLRWFCFEEYIFHCDIFNPFLQKHKELVRKNIYINSSNSGLAHIIKDIGKELVPKRFIYSKAYCDIPEEIMDTCINSWKQYTEGYELIELKEEDFNLNEENILLLAKENMDYELIRNYFLLKKLYEIGGILISVDTLISAPIGELRIYPLTFGFKNNNTINTNLIACKAKNMDIKAIFQMYLYQDKPVINNTEDYSMKKNLSEIMFEYFNNIVNLDIGNKNYDINKRVRILCGDKVSYKLTDINLTSTLYKESLLIRNKNMNVITNEDLIEHTKYMQELENSIRLLHRYKVQYERLFNSTCWKITKPIRVIGDFVKFTYLKLKKSKSGGR